MKANTALLTADTFFHIYNRGINGETIFKDAAGYIFFLKKYPKYVYPVARTYAYCLLKNHFHLLICTRSEEELVRAFPGSEVEKVISLQLSHFFNGYTQAVNKSFRRTGGLFESPFRRIAITEDAYLLQVIYYIHFNPEKHGFTNNFAHYPHSSYRSYLSDKETLLEREAGLDLFGGKQEFIAQHTLQKELSTLSADDF